LSNWKILKILLFIDFFLTSFEFSFLSSGGKEGAAPLGIGAGGAYFADRVEIAQKRGARAAVRVCEFLAEKGVVSN